MPVLALLTDDRTGEGLRAPSRSRFWIARHFSNACQKSGRAEAQAGQVRRGDGHSHAQAPRNGTGPADRSTPGPSVHWLPRMQATSAQPEHPDA